MAAWARITEGRLVADGLVALPDGSRLVRGHIEGEVDNAEEVGKVLAAVLVSCGAEEILKALGWS